METNTRNRFNTLAAITIKGESVKAVDFVILQTFIDTPLLVQLLKVLLEVHNFVQCYMFIIYNCTIHILSDNMGIQDALFRYHGVITIMFPAYHP